METVALELPLDAAKRFMSLSSLDKNRLYSLIVSWLVSPDTTEQKRIESKFRLIKLINEIGEEAVSRGITKEILNDILNEVSFYESEKHDLAVKKLLKTVETIGLNATKRGMTDEILEDILNEN